MRTRTCVLEKPNSKECQGEEREVKECLLGVKTDETVIAGGTGALWSIMILLILVIVGLVAYIFYEKRNRLKPFQQMPHSPHYAVVPNQYSSLPTKDVS